MNVLVESQTKLLPHIQDQHFHLHLFLESQMEEESSEEPCGHPVLVCSNEDGRSSMNRSLWISEQIFQGCFQL